MSLKPTSTTTIKPHSKLLFIGAFVTDCGRDRSADENSASENALGNGYVCFIDAPLGSRPIEYSIRVINHPNSIGHMIAARAWLEAIDFHWENSHKEHREYKDWMSERDFFQSVLFFVFSVLFVAISFEAIYSWRKAANGSSRAARLAG